MATFVENIKKLDKISIIFFIVNVLLWLPFECVALYSGELELILLVTGTGLIIYSLIIPGLYYPVLLRAILCFQIFVVTALYMLASTFITWVRTPRMQILPDLLYEIIPKGNEIHIPLLGDTTIVWMVDTTLYIVSGITVILVLSQSDRLTIIKRFCLHYTVMQVCRTICLLVTNLPDCSDLCRAIVYPLHLIIYIYKLYILNNNTPGTTLYKDIDYITVVRNTWNTLLHPYHFVTCGDVMFSGHTTLLVSVCLIWLTYFKPRNNRILNYVNSLVYFLVIMCLFGIIKSRFHYSLDVIVAIFLTLGTWNLIHSLAYNASHGIRIKEEWIWGEFYLLEFFDWLEKPERIMFTRKLPKIPRFPNPFEFFYNKIRDPSFYDNLFKHKKE
ncbi:hypothetical protein WA158_003086 [Blastocystis sp. Blastoise]